MYTGELAALGAAFCWSWTLIFFTAAGERVGAFQVNVIRLTFAVPMLFIAAMIIIGGTPMDWFAGGKPWLLILSGVIGLALGDIALFKSLILIGPRKTTLIFSTVPIMTAIIAWFTIQEKLAPLTFAGIVVTVGGVAWVVAERTVSRFDGTRRKFILGLLYAGLGTLGQAVGLVLTKAGMAGEMNPLPATLLRMVGGLVTAYLMTLMVGRTREVLRAMRNRRAMALIAGGSTFGPFAGVWLSMVAVLYAETGVAATLMGMVPIMMIPVVRIVYKEKISPRALWGTLLAVIGVALIFNR